MAEWLIRLALNHLALTSVVMGFDTSSWLQCGGIYSGPVSRNAFT